MPRWQYPNKYTHGFIFCQLWSSTETIVMMYYYWVYDVKATHVMPFEEMENWDTMVNYNNFFHLECCNLLLNQQLLLGWFDVNGQPTYVEVHKTYFSHRKYHRGTFRRGKWVVGILERNSGRCWMELVARRNAATLEQIITDHVLPGTIIVTDGWAGYDNIDRINDGVYHQEVAVYAHNFVDPQHAEVNTQAIEGLWMQAKRKLRYQSGTSHALFTSYLDDFYHDLDEFQWCYKSQNTHFRTVLEVAQWKLSHLTFCHIEMTISIINMIETHAFCTGVCFILFWCFLDWASVLANCIAMRHYSETGFRIWHRRSEDYQQISICTESVRSV